MSAPTPLVPVYDVFPEEGGQGQLIDRFSDHLTPASTAERVLEVRFQDDRSERWSKIKKISLGSRGETDIIRELAPMGTYRARQYELVFATAIQFSLLGMQENIIGLGGGA